MDGDTVAKWIMGLLASVLGVAASAGGLWAKVARNGKDIEKLDDECGACRGHVNQELQNLGGAVASVNTKLDMLINHNGLGKKRREGGE